MTFIPLRTVQNKPQEVDAELVRNPGQPVVVTRNGTPIWVVTPVDEEALYDHLLATNKPIMASLDRIAQGIAAGTEPLLPWEELRAQIDADVAALDEAERRP